MQQASPSSSLPRALRGIRGVQPLLAKLGTPYAVYSSAKIPLLARALGPFCILVGAIILASFLLYMQILFNWWLWWQADSIPLVGAIWIVVGLWYTLASLLQRRIRIAVCPNGLLYVGRRAEAVLWDTITNFWKNMRIDDKGRVLYTCKVQCRNDSMFVFKQDIDGIEQLGQRIERQGVQRLFPVATALYDKGSLVPFNEIALDAQGVHVKQKGATLSWDDVEHIGINQQVISIYKKGEYWDWATLPVADVPNVEVLRRLIAYARQEHDKVPLVRMIAAYNSGFPVSFGSITISRRGVDIGKKTLSWSEISGIGVGEQEIMIKRPSSVWGQDEWEVFPIRTVTDAPLLKGLVDYVLQDKQA